MCAGLPSAPSAPADPGAAGPSGGPGPSGRDGYHGWSAWAGVAFDLRTHRIGDVGWMLERHAVLYHEEHEYSDVFERYVSHTIPDFLDAFDPKLDRLWVAERDGRRVGCIAIRHVDVDVRSGRDADLSGWARLRWFLVAPEARGHGLGRQLLEAAVDFARSAGYRGITLLTVDDLDAARRLYERAGFTLHRQDSEPCVWAPWGHEQEWRLSLT